MASPAPLPIASAANPMGRRRMNQLLMAVGSPISSGPEKIIRPGTLQEIEGQRMGDEGQPDGHRARGK